jgi:predicted nuclease of predicted toxin-antitoxin system
VKILIDMNLTPRWCRVLEDAGHEARHWSEVGAVHASDETIMHWCRENGFVVFTHDLDHGILLYATRAISPSVIQVRSDDVDPSALALSVLKALRLAQSEIESGALMTVYMDRHRITLLPLEH